ncbi:MAG: hypothetical protein K0U41_03095 [Gammaproteobacteria bacterium]|nr:hypothetical protein [Gammaproteobacteria bacterium]
MDKNAAKIGKITIWFAKMFGEEALSDLRFSTFGNRAAFDSFVRTLGLHEYVGRDSVLIKNPYVHADGTKGKYIKINLIHQEEDLEGDFECYVIPDKEDWTEENKIKWLKLNN